MIRGQTPRCRKWTEQRDGRRIERDKAKQIEHVCRVGDREVLDPADERRMAHLQGDENTLVERKNTGICGSIGKQPATGLTPSLRISSICACCCFCAIARILLLQRGQLRLDELHLRHRAVALVGEREEHSLDDHCHAEDRQAEIADIFVYEIDEVEHRLGDEIEPAPIDQEVEFLDSERVDVCCRWSRLLARRRICASVARPRRLGATSTDGGDEIRLIILAAPRAQRQRSAPRRARIVPARSRRPNSGRKSRTIRRSTSSP